MFADIRFAGLEALNIRIPYFKNPSIDLIFKF